MKTLDGRVAIVTGASRGLGAATARVLCQQGAAVMLTDVLKDGERTAAELAAEGFKAAFVLHDVRNEESWKTAVDQTIAAFGDVHILVNNAGVTFNASFEHVSLADYQRVIDTNLFGAFRGMQAVLPSMKRTGNGSIVNIASTTTDQILSIAPCYGSSKAALANLTKSAALHCAEQDYGIRVNSVHPGTHATPMILAAGMAADLPQAKAIIDAIPMKRMGDPSEVGNVVAFLASDAASYVTGIEIFVDGGATIT